MLNANAALAGRDTNELREALMFDVCRILIAADRTTDPTILQDETRLRRLISERLAGIRQNFDVFELKPRNLGITVDYESARFRAQANAFVKVIEEWIQAAKEWTLEQMNESLSPATSTQIQTPSGLKRSGTEHE